jgi:acetate kinase
MKILTLNCGSSTVKYALFDMPDDRKLCYGLVDKIGQASARIEHVKSGKSYTQHRNCRNHPDALEWLMGFLTRPEQGVVEEL